MKWKRTAALAGVMLLAGATAAWWCRAPLKSALYGRGTGRDAWQQPERVLAALAIQPGERIADIGAGGGYFTFRLAAAAGAGGNVTAILAAPDDPRLPEEVDLVFVCNTYHHIADRAEYFRRVGARLRPGGRLAIVEYSGADNWFVRWFGHVTPAETIRAELQAAGYRQEAQHDFLPRQHFLVFGRAEPPQTP